MNIKRKIFKKGIYEFKTPLTTFWIEDEGCNNVAFDIVNNTEEDHKVMINGKHIKVDPNNYYDCQLRIRCKDLKLHKKYYLHSSNKLEYRTADELLSTYGITNNDTTLAISFPDYNEDCTDESSYEYCGFDYEQPFAFTLYDYKSEYIYLPIAWISNIKDHVTNYEDAADAWTWTVFDTMLNYTPGKKA